MARHNGLRRDEANMLRCLFFILVFFSLPQRVEAQTLVAADIGTACGRESDPEYSNFSEDCGYSYRLVISPAWLPNWRFAFRADATERTQPSWVDGNDSNTIVMGPAIIENDRWLLGDVTYFAAFDAGLIAGELYAGGRMAHTSRRVEYRSDFAVNIPSDKYEFVGGGPIIGISAALPLSSNWSIEGEAEGAVLLGKRDNPKGSLVSDEAAYQGSLGAALSLVWTPLEGDWRIAGGVRATHWIDFVVDKQKVDPRYWDHCSCTHIETAVDRTVLTPFVRISAPLP